jgi:alanine racemase
MRTKKNIKNKLSCTKRKFVNKQIQVIVDTDAIRHNLAYLKSKSKTELMPVLKSNAYGHGIVEMSKIIRDLNIKYIGVATINEALLLRQHGDKGRILAWLYDIDGQEIKDAIHLDIDIAIYDDTTIEKFIKLIPKHKKVNITVFVNTGINMIGVPYEKAIELCILLNTIPTIKLEGIMSHMVSNNKKFVNIQLDKFRKLIQNLKNIGIHPPLTHIAKTGVCLNYDVSDFTLSRCGEGIYGILDYFKIDKHLKLATTVKSYIIQIKDIEKGEGIGYDWTYITPYRKKICIVPVGYADILPRNTSLKLYVYINGTKRRVLGIITMNQIVIESKETDKINDEVYLFGNGINCPQTVYDIAKIANTIPHEILSRFSSTIERIYL